MESVTLWANTISSLIGATSCIKKPATQADDFELKIGLIRMVQNDCQFGGLLNDDSYEHITNFLEICDTQQYSGVPAENVRLMIFLFLLRDKARLWFKFLLTESIHERRWRTNFSPNTFHPQNQQNFEVIPQPLPNLILNLFMMVGKGTR